MDTSSPSSPTTTGKWALQGFDTFGGEYYSIPGEYDSREAARKAAVARLDELEESQPSRTSGGQSGIQDQVYILAPDGTLERILG